MTALTIREQEVLAGAEPDGRDRALYLDRAFQHLGRPLKRALEDLALSLGLPFRTLQGKFYRWRESGLVACIDGRSINRGGNRRAPRKAIEFWLSLQLEYQRDTSLTECHREFVRLWKKGEVPGLPADCKVDPATGLPPGCTYNSLRRKTLTDYQAKAVRIGKHAASQLLPKVLSTRVGLLPGQVVEFDDQEHDVQVTFLGVNRTLTRPTGFHTLDYCSGCDTLQSFKPTILNPDGSRQKLRQIDFEWFTIAYLTQIGFREDTGTEFIWELGTSKAGSAFIERMLRATNDKVSIRQSGLHREPALAGLFHGPAKGNPRVKGARECWFRLFREHSSYLLANTGKDRDHAPEGMQALEREARLLIQAMAALPAVRADLLQLPCLTWTQFVAAAQTIVGLINQRTTHQLEGWEQLGHIAHEWRFTLDSPWLPQSKYLALPEPEKQIFSGLLRQTPELWRTRRLSPAEVWEPAKRDLKRVTGAAVPLLFGPEHARAERVEQDLTILIQDREISPDGLVYEAVLTNGRHLERGRQVAVYLNPFAPDEIQVCDDKYRWLGAAPLLRRGGKMDRDAAHRRYARIRKITSEELAPVARMGAAITERETKRLTNNAKVLDLSRPFTAEEKEADARRRERNLPLEEMPDAPAKEKRPIFSLDEMPDAPAKRERRNLDLDDAI